MSVKKGLNKWSTFIHKWLGLAIGIQMLLWVLSGVVMTLVNIELHDEWPEYGIAEQPPFEITGTDPIFPIQTIIQTAGKSAQNATLKALGGKPVYQVNFGEGGPDLYDATTGELLTPIGADMALELALLDFKPEANPAAPVWLTETNNEYRRGVPVWMIDMLDEEGTHLYISPQTGQIVARRPAVWRLFNFFWMLHIMDYENRTNISNPLIIWTAIFALVFSITGFVMLFFRFKRRDFGIRAKTKKYT
ncbi:MAG: PepSY domain-containing protein [Proteobacteria bacterium]|nr:PepSY domain-containing protein [Pseudomonadota bacterium]